MALEDGSYWVGKGFGAKKTVVGEVVFNTSMTGYQEVLTDPSYHGQIVTMTYPHIGNYGVNQFDVESERPQVAGFVVRELSRQVSSWRAEAGLKEYLEAYGIPAIQGIDTRAITKKLRVFGAMKGVLSTEGIAPEEAVQRARAWSGIVGADFVQYVTRREPFVWDPEGLLSGEFRLAFGGELVTDPRLLRHPVPPADIKIIAIDFGVKFNILRCLRRRGFLVEVVPAFTSSEEILRRKPAAIFLSNGPGDPAAVEYGIRTVRELLDTGIPMFGICLGHQVLALALGGRTFKLKFGHRGANQPVKDLRSGRVEITSQNHGFAVDRESLPPEVEVDRVNLNDGTVEGLRHRNGRIFSVQYHPEASPGPHDAEGLFDEFRRVVEQNA